jgi:hypothetical protein
MGNGGVSFVGRVWLCAPALACTIACSAHESESTAENQAETTATLEPAPLGPEAPELTPSTPPVPKPAAPPRQPDKGQPAYFLSPNDIIARLDDAGWSVVWGPGQGYVQSIFAGPDGNLYVHDSKGVHRIVGTSRHTLLSFDHRGSSATSGTSSDLPPELLDRMGLLVPSSDVLERMRHLALGHDGELWFAGDGWDADTGVAVVRRDGTWTWNAGDSMGIEDHSISGLVVDAGGTVWLLSRHGILFKRGDRWWRRIQSWELSEREGSPPELGLGSSGEVFVLAYDGLLRLDSKGEIRERAAVDLEWPHALALGPGDQAVISDKDCALRRYDFSQPGPALEQNPDGPPAAGREPVWSRPASTGVCSDTGALAIDGLRRIWIAGRQGLAVIDEAGEVAYPRGSVPALSGRVSEIVVFGDGPTLPTPGPLLRGGLRARIIVDGKPFAHQTMYVRSHANQIEVETDAHGVMSLDELVVDDWQVSFKSSENYMSADFSIRGVEIEAGEILDLGELYWTHDRDHKLAHFSERKAAK